MGNEGELAKKANDFEEEHGWCPDYGYESPDEVIPNTGGMTVREAYDIVWKAVGDYGETIKLGGEKNEQDYY